MASVVGELIVPGASTQAIQMSGSGGSKAGESFEDEDSVLAGRQSATPGTIDWPSYTWDGEANNGLWSDPVN
ncbi:MAG: hypothetical protein IIA44_08700, partial [Acidobacteria bacterium]|nr:hypothetical protein [Acidobacteriota bacterium]